MQHRKETVYFKSNASGAPAPARQILRAGIYSGSFDPIHAGHIAFALKAQEITGLDHIFFIPERRPKANPEAEHYTHRLAMARQALKPYDQFSVLDLPDTHLKLSSLPRIRRQVAADASLALLVGADELLEVKPARIPKLFQQLTLVIAITSNAQLAELLERINGSGLHFRSLHFVDIGPKRISSQTIRRSLRRSQLSNGLLPSVRQYARNQWLYISLK